VSAFGFLVWIEVGMMLSAWETPEKDFAKRISQKDLG
jgi:hypothetical protein